MTQNTRTHVPKSCREIIEDGKRPMKIASAAWRILALVVLAATVIAAAPEASADPSATLPAPAQTQDETPAQTLAKALTEDPREAGIRYGQALGVAAVCVNMQATEKTQALAAAFSGEDLVTFKTQADSVLKSWEKLLYCSHPNDPNPCRLTHQLSCREAFKEIGTYGSVAPGLVEFGATP